MAFQNDGKKLTIVILHIAIFKIVAQITKFKHAKLIKQ